MRGPAHGLVPELTPLAGALPGLHLLPRWSPAPGAQVRHGASSADQNGPLSFRYHPGVYSVAPGVIARGPQPLRSPHDATALSLGILSGHLPG